MPEPDHVEEPALLRSLSVIVYIDTFIRTVYLLLYKDIRIPFRPSPFEGADYMSKASTLHVRVSKM